MGAIGAAVTRAVESEQRCARSWAAPADSQWIQFRRVPNCAPEIESKLILAHMRAQLLDERARPGA